MTDRRLIILGIVHRQQYPTGCTDLYFGEPSINDILIMYYHELQFAAKEFS